MEATTPTGGIEAVPPRANYVVQLAGAASPPA